MREGKLVEIPREWVAKGVTSMDIASDWLEKQYLGLKKNRRRVKKMLRGGSSGV